MKIRVGTRDSKLAMIQTEIVVDYIKNYDSSIEIEIIPMKTTGDKILNVTLDKIGGKGLFVKELDEALLMDHVDITVHSFKDMPMDENPELPIVAVSEREDPRDVLIMRKLEDGTTARMHKDMLIGTSSQRRQLQLQSMGYENMKPIRGNLVTRLKKLDSGEFDAIVLAAAGVKRSGMEERIAQYFTVEEVIPAACQGNLVVQGRAGKDYSYLDGFHNVAAHTIAKAERAFVRTLDGGCSTPTAAYATVEDGQMTIKGLFQDDKNSVLIKKIIGDAKDGELLGSTLAKMMLQEHTKEKGAVALVGAGPGEASLLTLRAKELIETADVVVYDRLVSSEIMDMIPERIRRINVGKENNHHRIPQDEINQILVEEAIEGNMVVRLKGGDPFVFGRGGEELEDLVANQIPYEVVPGITSAIAAPSFAGFPVTHRDFCSSFHVITAHQKKNEALKIDFESLVKTQGTLIFLMGVSTLKDICDGLQEAGMKADMPAALVENGTRAYQRKLIGTIENLYEKALEAQFRSPSIIIVGKVCTLSQDFDWFSKRELFGKKIIVTSPVNSNGKLQKSLRTLGAQVYDLPMIQIEPLPIDVELKKEILQIQEYQYLMFTSKNGVAMFFEYLEKLGKDARILWNTKVVAIGPSTSDALKSYGVIADFIPKHYNVNSLLDELIPEIKANEKVLILRAEMGTYDLIQGFQEAGVTYRELKIYKSAYVKQEAVAEITKEEVMVCFTSASTVESFVQNNPNVDNVLGICIGDQTAQAARKYGIAHRVSEQATIQSMIDKIKELS
ncbi:MAG: uroporphyrinogen-III C-methyltransferase [Eubacteriales bacterium]